MTESLALAVTELQERRMELCAYLQTPVNSYVSVFAEADLEREKVAPEVQVANTWCRTGATELSWSGRRLMVVPSWCL